MLINRLKQFVQWNIVSPITDQCYRSTRRFSQELLYQNLFDTQCARQNLREPFYPLGAAANYSLMYLIFRLLEEFDFKRIIELGSGQTTILIDRLKPSETIHIAYEHVEDWHAHLAPKLSSVDYRLRALSKQTVEGRDCTWYENVVPDDFDLLLIDGPYGVPYYSRLGALELITRNSNKDFLILLDDTHRTGETQTAQLIKETLSKRTEVGTKEIIAMKNQTLFATARFRHALFF